MPLNDEVKEILIDLIEYYNFFGTDDDPGIEIFENVARRASKALKQYATNIAEGKQNNNSSDVDPFKDYDEFPDDIIKLEEEW
jgi:hypothetical protein